MQKSKIILGAVALLFAGVSAFASSVNYRSFTAYYISGNTCLPFVTDKECLPGDPTCIDEVQPGVNRLLHQTRVAIPNTDRFECQIELEEQP